MAAPKGNHNAKGNKGGGRKSAYQELADATEAYRIFFDEHDQAEIEGKIFSGKFSLADRFILTGMEGDTAVINKAYQKAVPDTVDHTTKGEKLPTPILNVLSNNSDPQGQQA
jgi:hypothetical protein